MVKTHNFLGGNSQLQPAQFGAHLAYLSEAVLSNSAVPKADLLQRAAECFQHVLYPQIRDLRFSIR